MKCKKISYILVFILMLMVGINNIYAVESNYCYYIGSDNKFKASVKLSWDYDRDLFGAPWFTTYDDYSDVSVDKIGDKYAFDKEVIINWINAADFYPDCVSGDSVCFNSHYHSSYTDVNDDSNPDCPKYLVFQYCTLYHVWATESETKAQEAVDAINSQNGCVGYYASVESNGKPITSEEYYQEFVDGGFITIDDNGELECDELLGNESNPDSLRHLIDEILDYVRIIVPILIILLGSLDLAKAVISGKEDIIKKAQTDFAKRLIAGVIIFLVPTLIDIVMELAEIVWQGEGYKICNL